MMFIKLRREQRTEECLSARHEATFIFHPHLLEWSESKQTICFHYYHSQSNTENTPVKQTTFSCGNQINSHLKKKKKKKKKKE